MYSTNKIILYTVLFCLFAISCKKNWFEEKHDKSVTVLSTISEFEMLLDAMSTQTPGLGEVASDGHYVDSSLYSIISTISDPSAYIQRNAYTWSLNFPYTKVLDWNTAYSRVFKCNLALDGLSKIKPSNPNEMEHYNQVKGNALFHRAKSYYDLCQIYAIPYDSKDPNDKLGIPLKEGIDITELSTRSSVKECYEQITTDLLAAIQLLPPKQLYLTRGSKSASFALIARTYLVMQDYSNAGRFADSCLKINKTLIDLNLVSANNSNMGRFNDETLFYSTMIPWDLIGNSNCFVDSSLYKQYGLNDLRATRFFRKNSNGTITFKGNYTNTGSLQFSGIAIDEVVLIRAECYARKGDVTNAMKFLNDLLVTRWDNKIVYQQITAATPKEALDKILLERKKELLFRGIRWSDLRRFNLESSTQEILTRRVEGRTYTLEPNSYKYTFPIPSDVLALAPKMEQTPGWD